METTMTIERTPVISSNIASVGYDQESETLEVEFVGSGRVYRYFGVPVEIKDDLVDAPSIGSYFYHHIRDVYEYQPMN